MKRQRAFEWVQDQLFEICHPENYITESTHIHRELCMDSLDMTEFEMEAERRFELQDGELYNQLSKCETVGDITDVIIGVI